MRQPSQLSLEELIAIATAIQQALYLDFSHENKPIWNPDKDWDSADVCDQLAAELARFDLVPQLVIAIEPQARS